MYVSKKWNIGNHVYIELYNSSIDTANKSRSRLHLNNHDVKQAREPALIHVFFSLLALLHMSKHLT